MERFYRALTPPVTIGIETTGYTQWCHALMHRLGHTVLVGEAAKIRALVVRKTKTDRCDVRHLLALLKHDRFPRAAAAHKAPGADRRQASERRRGAASNRLDGAGSTG